MQTEQTENVPLMYKGWVIRKVKLPFPPEKGTPKKYAAYNFATDYFINPLYDTWEQLKSIIDAMK